MKAKCVLCLAVFIFLASASVSAWAYPYVRCTEEEKRQGITDQYLCVEIGDYFEKIYSDHVYYKTKWTRQEFAEKNSIPWDMRTLVYKGQKLIISDKAGAEPREPEEPKYNEYISKEGDDIYELYLEYSMGNIGVTMNDFMETNKQIKLRQVGDSNSWEIYPPGQKVLIPLQAISREFKLVYGKNIYDQAGIFSTKDKESIQKKLDYLNVDLKVPVIVLILDSLKQNHVEYARKAFTETYGNILDSGQNRNSLLVMLIKNYYGEKNKLIYFGYKKTSGGLIGYLGTSQFSGMLSAADTKEQYLTLMSGIIDHVTDTVEKKVVSEADALLEKADGFIGRKDYANAERALRAVWDRYREIQQGPKAMLKLGNMFYEKGDLPMAYAVCLEAYNGIKDVKTKNYIADNYAAVFLKGAMVTIYEMGDCSKAMKHADELQANCKNVVEKDDAINEKLNKVKQSCARSQNANCEQLQMSETGEGAINIIFVADNFGSYDDIRTEASEAIKGFFEADIIRENSDAFNFYLYKKTFDNFCFDVYYISHNADNPMLGVTCGLPNEIFVFISRTDIRGYANYFSTVKNYFCASSLNGLSKMRETTLHELGHAAFGLKDEYVEKGKGDKSGEPNCAPDIETAREWWGDLEPEGAGYYNGCAYLEKNIKPTKKSIMSCNYDGFYFGPVNERQITKKIEEMKKSYEKTKELYDFLAKIDNKERGLA